jgi:NAD(P)H-dependent FMN reductase
MPQLLIVWHSHGWRSRCLAEAAAEGAGTAGEGIVVLRHAAAAGLEDLLAADACLWVTPECFGSLSGLLKDFFERVYHPAREQVAGRAYAQIVCAGEDGRGAVMQIQRICRGLALKEVQPPLIVPSREVEARLGEARELGATLAQGLLLGLW